MDFQNIQTVKELIHALKQYNQNLATTIFDDTQGYISVAFKKDKLEKNGNDFQFLCFYPNYEVALYPVVTLLSYLEKLPEQATIAIKNSDGNYSSLYLTIDETIDKGTKYKWLVISDRLSYERFYLTSQLTIQEQALEKMLKELETEPNNRLEAIHDWLCQQTDKDLLTGILKEDRTLKGAEAYCIQKAYEIRNGNGAMASHITVFNWVREYYTLDELPTDKPKIQATIKSDYINQKIQRPTPVETKNNNEIDLFEGEDF